MSGRRCLWMVLVLACAPALAGLQAQAPPIIDREYEIKAAYLRFFGMYTQWPGALGNAKDFSIGVVGKDPFGGVLEKLAKEKTVDGKPIVIQRFKDLTEVKPVHVLFVGKDDNLAEAVKQLKGLATLLVADVEGAAAQGAVADFYIDDNKVKIAINPEAAKLLGLKISSQLLQVAKIVKPKE